MLIDGLISLVTASAVNGLISGRIYEGELPRGYALPAIAVHEYNEAQDYDMAGPVGVREDFIQFDTYGSSQAIARQVREALKTLLDGYVGTLPDGTVVQACYLER